VIVEWTSPAEDELDEVWSFIAVDNIDAADRTVERLRLAAATLGEHPGIGRLGRMADTRELVVPSLPYLLIYRVVGQTVFILRVYHGARRWPPS
jgi:addiction module RelE/StbE family toxin